MGQAQLVTATALAVYRDTKKEIVDATNAGEITPLVASRIYGQLIRLADAMQFAHNRIRVANLAMRDVHDARNIERVCIPAYISPVDFDLGPSNEAA